jgi:hypothetical protein
MQLQRQLTMNRKVYTRMGYDKEDAFSTLVSLFIIQLILCDLQSYKSQ